MANRLQSTLATAALLASLTGCATEEKAADTRGADGSNVSLEWEKGQVFYMAASYRRANVKTAEIAVNLEDAFDGTAERQFGEDWSEDVVWTYQVVESGLVPTPDDELYRFAETRKGVASLAVIKVSLDLSLNTDEALLESDPVIYMVFREDRDRMAGLISFVNNNGERIESAYSATELDRSWSTLSQSMLTKVPTYLAPFSAKFGNADRMLENGANVSSYKVTDGVADVVFGDVMGGEEVVTRYEVGAPWPTSTITGNLDARLLTDGEVDDLRFASGGMYPMPSEDSFDYRAALKTSVDMDKALVLSEEFISTGKESSEVGQDYKPWAGSWWALKKGELIWGYNNRNTFSDRIKDEVDPIKQEMDKLSAEIRDLKEDSDKDERDEKRKLYGEKQTELVEKIKEFYGKIQSDLDGGKLVYESGKLTHAEDDWSYDLNELSPMDKYALAQYDAGDDVNNPFFISAWEILNSYNPGGESWWGHCNGWAAAAILTNEPRESVTHRIGENDVEFTTADQKGLLTESHYSTYSQFYGERYNGEDDNVSDLSPKAFHNLITFFIKEQGVPMVFDTTATEAVWNFPAYGYDMNMTETTDAGEADKVNINTASFEELVGLYGIGESLAQRILDYRSEVGPFQNIEEITKVDGIGENTFDMVKGDITTTAAQRSFTVTARVTLTTDGVDEEHVDGDEPRNFTDTWRYTLHTDANGTVVGGEWDNEKDHPDFAWIPYLNPSTASNGSSENPFLGYSELLDILGDGVDRQ
jgi:competence ComEA-like helix-hairpin-helix protein